jgi:hypothetical protein
MASGGFGPELVDTGQIQFVLTLRRFRRDLGSVPTLPQPEADITATTRIDKVADAGIC